MSSCGTGTGNFPQPGDPGTSLIIQATGVFGGIQVVWDFPDLNPHAVAHFNLYRSTANDPATAVRIWRGSAEHYLDTLDTISPNLVYYYWVQVISVNGTEGTLEGPASAQVAPLNSQIIGQISGQILNSDLALSLRNELAEIPSIKGSLNQEIADRLSGDDALSQSLNDLFSDVSAIDVAVQNEITTRVTQNSALVSTVDAIGARVGNNEAAIIDLQNTSAGDSAVTARRVTALYAAFGGITPVYESPNPPAEPLEVDALWVDTDDNYAVYRWDGAAWVPHTAGYHSQTQAAISDEALARSTADDALTSQVNTALSIANSKAQIFRQPTEPPTNAPNLSEGDLWYDTDDSNRPYVWDGTAWVDVRDGEIAANFAAIQSESTTRANADSALASDISTLTARADDPATGFQANANAVSQLSTDVGPIPTGYQSHSEAITQIESEIENPTTGLKARAQALEDFDTNVVGTPGGGYSSFAQWTNALQSTIEHPTTGLSATASVAQDAQTRVGTTEGQITDLHAEYTVKVAVDGGNGDLYMAGFGLSATGGPNYNSQVHTRAIFHVDEFAIGKPGVTAAYPFVVTGGVTYLNAAVIADASIDNAKIGNLAASKIIAGTMANGMTIPNGTIQGGSLSIGDGSAGSFQVNTAGEVTINGLVSGARMAMTKDKIEVWDGVNTTTPRVRLGKLN